MKEDETLLKACSTPLPADVDERSQGIQKEEDAKSSLLVYDFVSEVCVACEVVLKSPWRSPLCYRCHTSLYPHRTISEEEFDSEQDLERFQKFNAIPHMVQDTSMDDELFNRFPDDILMHIFSYLDENGLYKASQVCQKWHGLAEERVWKVQFKKKWPVFRPVGSVSCWRDLYFKMMEASTCLPCLEESFNGKIIAVPETPRAPNLWIQNRLSDNLQELRDMPDGIRACPVDDERLNWQVSIAGPPNSVYENGIFYLHLELPKNYPFHPPRLRFLTRIFHPNVNRHGDIGLDIPLHQNWTPALTESMVLVSIQSLLTDPYCHVCMEHVVGQMYTEDREYFNIVARDWTRKFAQHHYQNSEHNLIDVQN
ncbi:uncharacterized protein LOC124436317 [Xenia sp. Carnegie-2017]|uniref:uncharacterized protein LOC124436317 n=1 Tax=Xenia sp. Carnegie-2017 TaxID=2897299 RepID=UPI001F03C6E1|nr:uncharacterized protein LOC124436317 [Xenia sp. Carnegie-2017]